MENTPLMQDENKNVHPYRLDSAAMEREYGEFIDMAVHDLDAPLRKLTLLVGMLVDRISPDNDTQGYIDRIGHCVNDMRSLVDDLSIIAKLASEGGEYTNCSIENIVKLSLAELPVAGGESKVLVSTGPLPTISGQPAHMGRLFRNLLDNAIKFSQKDRQPEVHISSTILEDDEKLQLELPLHNVYHKLAISDNGIGFKNEFAEKIFQPFVRLHGKSQYPGNGMGLAICKKIVTMHGGVIYAESRENEGSRFIIVLPEIH